MSLFSIKESGSTVRTEILAGVTTFVTMSYIVVLNPAILKSAGIPPGPSMVATVLAAAFGTLVMAFYARRPFAIAPYMGENAFIAFTVVGTLGFSWQTSLGAVFLGGVLFTLLTVLRLRSWVVGAIPDCLKYSFAVGIGLFLAFLGLKDAGLVTVGTASAPVRVGDLTSPETLLAVFGFLLICTLMVRRVKGALLISIVVTTLLSFLLGLSKVPDRLVSLPPSVSPILFKLDVRGALTWSFFPVILTVFILDFVDTMGTLIGVSARAGFLDRDGNLPEIEKPMLADAVATVFGSLVGTTTTGTFIESAAGVEAGGRTGLTSVVVALLFLGTLLFAPFLTAVPPAAYGPAIIAVGLLMVSPIRRIDLDDYTEAIPAFGVVVLMCFTLNIGIGFTAGFVLYPLLKLVSGRRKEIKPGLWVLFALSVLFFVFYPYE